jgi:type IV pilus assembly protein PilE
MERTQSGFTLMELMIVVAIIGILSSIAIPSYQDSVRKSRRADAKAALLGLANAMERHFTEINSYCDAGGTGGGDSCGGGDNDNGEPSIYTVDSETNNYYTVTINAADASSYTLWAAPTGGQAGDKCGTLTLTHLGAKGFTGTGVTAADCW